MPLHGRRCGVCGKPGHRMDTCTHPAGKLVSKLSAKLKNKTPEKRKPQRRKPMSTGAHRARASAAYTKRPELKGHKGRRCRRGRCPADSGGDSVVTLTDAAESPDRAIKLLPGRWLLVPAGALPRVRRASGPLAREAGSQPGPAVPPLLVQVLQEVHERALVRVLRGGRLRAEAHAPPAGAVCRAVPQL